MTYNNSKDSAPDFLLKLYHILEVLNILIFRSSNFQHLFAGPMKEPKLLSKTEKKYKLKFYPIFTGIRNYLHLSGK